MISRIVLALTAAALASSLAACAAAPTPPADEPKPLPPVEQPSDNPAAGAKLAPGAYDMENGTTQILGNLEYRDIEGGTWLITGGTQADGDEGKVLAVIANAGDFEAKLRALKDQQVFATGKKLDGVSVRMAGPEYEITEINTVSDTGDPAAQ